MSRKVPPGLQYIANNVLFLLLPPILTYLAIFSLCRVINVGIPLWLQDILISGAMPATAMASLYATHFYQEYRARSRGAALPVTARYKWPGGLDLLYSVLKARGAAYPGMPYVVLVMRVQTKLCCVTYRYPSTTDDGAVWVHAPDVSRI
jgi:hypothetical protein